MPFTALIGVPPESVPPLEAGSSASPIEPVKPCTTCSEASSAATCTGGVIVAPASVVWCGSWVNPKCVGGGGGGGGPGVMSNATLVSTGGALPNAAVRVKPTPTESIRRLGKVATPATADATPPASAAFLEMLPSVPIPSRIDPAKFVAVFPSESYAVTCTGFIALSCVVTLGCPVNASTVAGAGMTLRSEEHTSELQSLAYLVC